MNPWDWPQAKHSGMWPIYLKSLPSNSRLCGNVAINCFWHSHIQKYEQLQDKQKLKHVDIFTQKWPFITEVQRIKQLLCGVGRAQMIWWINYKEVDSASAQRRIETKCGQRIGTLALLLSFPVLPSFWGGLQANTLTDTYTPSPSRRLPNQYIWILLHCYVMLISCSVWPLYQDTVFIPLPVWLPHRLYGLPAWQSLYTASRDVLL